MLGSLQPGITHVPSSAVASGEWLMAAGLVHPRKGRAHEPSSKSAPKPWPTRLAMQPMYRQLPSSVAAALTKLTASESLQPAAPLWHWCPGYVANTL
eukprot:1939436-Prymnesium_polylepis.2